MHQARRSCARGEPTIISTALRLALCRSRMRLPKRRLLKHGRSGLTAGTSAVLAAKLATTDGRIVCICARTANGGTVAARVITPATGMHGGILADKDSGRPRLARRPNGLQLSGQPHTSDSSWFGRIVLKLNMRMR